MMQSATQQLDKSRQYWFGLKWRQNANKFKWLDGTALGSWNEWFPVEPNSPEQCVYVRLVYENRWGWRDMDCSRVYNYLCQKPIPPDSSSSSTTRPTVTSSTFTTSTTQSTSIPTFSSVITPSFATLVTSITSTTKPSVPTENVLHISLCTKLPDPQSTLPTSTEVGKSRLLTSNDVTQSTLPTSTDITQSRLQTSTDVTQSTFPITIDIKKSSFPISTDIIKAALQTFTGVTQSKLSALTDVTRSTFLTSTDVIQSTLPRLTDVTKFLQSTSATMNIEVFESTVDQTAGRTLYESDVQSPKTTPVEWDEATTINIFNSTILDSSIVTPEYEILTSKEILATDVVTNPVVPIPTEEHKRVIKQARPKDPCTKQQESVIRVTRQGSNNGAMLKIYCKDLEEPRRVRQSTDHTHEPSVNNRKDTLQKYRPNFRRSRRPAVESDSGGIIGLITMATVGLVIVIIIVSDIAQIARSMKKAKKIMIKKYRNGHHAHKRQKYIAPRNRVSSL